MKDCDCKHKLIGGGLNNDHIDGRKSVATMNDIHEHLRHINTTDGELTMRNKHMRKPNHLAHELIRTHFFDYNTK